MVKLAQAIPALPVHDASSSLSFDRDRLGFEVLHEVGGLDARWQPRHVFQRVSE